MVNTDKVNMIPLQQWKLKNEPTTCLNKCDCLN